MPSPPVGVGWRKLVLLLLRKTAEQRAGYLPGAVVAVVSTLSPALAPSSPSPHFLVLVAVTSLPFWALVFWAL